MRINPTKSCARDPDKLRCVRAEKRKQTQKDLITHSLDGGVFSITATFSTCVGILIWKMEKSHFPFFCEACRLENCPDATWPSLSEKRTPGAPKSTQQTPALKILSELN
jgi:hypothetical protein